MVPGHSIGADAGAGNLLPEQSRVATKIAGVRTGS
jgi:hypothetical protein